MRLTGIFDAGSSGALDLQESSPEQESSTSSRATPRRKKAMVDLASKRCIPCRGDVPPLSRSEQQNLLPQLEGEWCLVDGHHLFRHFQFRDYVRALEFTNQVSNVAEQEGHHPEILLGWGKVEIKIWTHAIDGLTESDFILAAKIDRLPRL
jgi:4a-hydroxytetrahydrobiopterin dehydratase